MSVALFKYRNKEIWSKTFAVFTWTKIWGAKPPVQLSKGLISLIKTGLLGSLDLNSKTPHAPLCCNYLCRVLNKHNHSCAEKQRAARAVHRGELCCHRISPQTNLRPYFTRRQMDSFPGRRRLGCNSRQTQKVSDAQKKKKKKITAAFMRRPML